MNNYRPIWLIIGFSKNQHLQVNKILVPEKLGFRKGVTIQQPIFTLTNSILSALNKWKKAGGIFCDLSKAFTISDIIF
jgi:hypothetical protein